jgi:methyltransferase (TIGR00027 family)
MIEGQFSRTALSAAGLRAAHQIADSASVFVDPLSTKILRDDLHIHLERAADPALRPLRLFVALRSRLAEDNAKRRIGQGVRQVVVLGAGLDTFAARLEPSEGLRVFEVDHPATQGEKRRRLSAAGIPTPAHLVFAPCDFERENLAEKLAAAGFDEAAAATFLWLGVTPYLTREAFEATLRFVAELKGGASIVFDYANPVHSIDSAGHRLFHERMAARVAELGETFRSAFDTPELHAFLHALGACEIDDYGPRRIAELFAPGAPPPPENGGHILRAAFPAR